MVLQSDPESLLCQPCSARTRTSPSMSSTNFCSKFQTIMQRETQVTERSQTLLAQAAFCVAEHSSRNRKKSACKWHTKHMLDAQAGVVEAHGCHHFSAVTVQHADKAICQTVALALAQHQPRLYQKLNRSANASPFLAGGFACSAPDCR